MNNSKYPFLSLLKTKLDDAQSTALETTENAVIAAGAGSGKTQVLATRFAWLILTGKAKADEILTLTFTNKAAAEMYQRIYSTLKFYAEHEICPGLSEKQRQLARNGLSDFANAHIQTLDSYCANIVRQCSNRYGIRPDFSTGSSDGIRDVKNRALTFTLKNASAPGIATFADPGQLQSFAEKTIASAINKFTDLTSPKDFFTSRLPDQTKEICKALDFYFANTQKSDEYFPCGYNIRKIHEDINSQFAADKTPKTHLAYKTAVDNAFEQLDSLLGFNFSDNLPLHTSEAFAALTEKFNEFKKLIKYSTTLTGKLTSANTLIIKIRDDLCNVIDSLISYVNQYDSIVSLYSLLDTFLMKVNSAKRISGNLSFGDVSALALKILIENEDIREQEIAAYKKIMIDEFQDNNGKNRDLLYLLSLKPGTKIISQKDDSTALSIHDQIIIKNDQDLIVEDKRSPEKLFFVGDEKQSIYKFRGADVSVFNELTQFNENKLIPMTYNYRSNDATVAAFNLIFKNGNGIFSETSSRIDYEAYYEKDALKNGKTLPDLTSDTVPLHFRFVNTNKISNENENILNSSSKLLPPDEQIAYDIANQIYTMGNESKNWNAFAILAKGRTHQNILTKYLSRFNIPYEVDAFKNIFEDGVINDIYNFLRLCVYPSDINAFSSYLCSPLAGLAEESLEIILSHLVDISNHDFVFNPFVPVSDQLKSDLPASELEKFLHAKAFLEEIRSSVLQQNITATLNILWNKTGYKYETMLTPQTELAAEHFDMIFELARTCEEQGKTVSWFIDELENLKKSMSSDDSDIDAADISYPMERSEAVKIMTIHKSKGLQFEHVFLCDCTDVRVKTENSTVFYDDKYGLSIKPEKGSGNYFCIRQKELETKKELAEFRRLIYVGITRAIKDVYITGKWAPQGDSYQGKSPFHIFELMAEKNYGLNEDETVSYNVGKAFDFVNIIPVSYEESGNVSAQLSKQAALPLSMDDIRQKKISESWQKYENAEEIAYKFNAIPRLAPSDLETNTSLTYDESPAEEKYTSDFTPADFGTLIHAYLEAWINGIEPEQFTPPYRLYKNLNQKEQLSVTEECIDFCRLFQQTSLAQDFIAAKNAGNFYRAEWGFKMFWDNTLWTGSIDLIYQNADGTYTIVDYKSDAKIDKGKYVGQQNCYRTAASKLLKIDESKIHCKLWFMRSNQIISLAPDDHQ